MSLINRRTCYSCEITLTRACVQAVPVPLCGLCRLMPLDELTRYLGRWNPTVLELEQPRPRQENAA